MMEVRFVCPFWRRPRRMPRGLSRSFSWWLSMVGRFSVVRWRRVSADRKRTMWEVRHSWMGMIPLWWTGAVLATMERWLREVRLLEMWVVKLLVEFLVPLVSVNLLIEVVGGALSFLSNCLDKTLEAIAFLDLWFETVCSHYANRLFLLEDQILKLL
jgi:hypothetical protein